MAMRAQLPRPGVAAGTGLVDDLQRFGLPSRPSGFDSAPHCGGTVPTKRGSWRPLGGHPDRDGIDVRVQADEGSDSLIHGLPPLTGAVNRSQALCVWIGAPRGVTHDTPEADFFPSTFNIQLDCRPCTSGHVV